MFGKINVFYLLLAIYLFIFIICYIFAAKNKQDVKNINHAIYHIYIRNQ